jgi:hypothetical protein
MAGGLVAGHGVAKGVTRCIGAHVRPKPSLNADAHRRAFSPPAVAG